MLTCTSCLSYFDEEDVHKILLESKDGKSVFCSAKCKRQHLSYFERCKKVIQEVANQKPFGLEWLITMLWRFDLIEDEQFSVRYGEYTAEFSGHIGKRKFHISYRQNGSSGGRMGGHNFYDLYYFKLLCSIDRNKLTKRFENLNAIIYTIAKDKSWKNNEVDFATSLPSMHLNLRELSRRLNAVYLQRKYLQHLKWKNSIKSVDIIIDNLYIAGLLSRASAFAMICHDVELDLQPLHLCLMNYFKSINLYAESFPFRSKENVEQFYEVLDQDGFCTVTKEKWLENVQFDKR